jgi:hypothetical protein
MAMTASSPSGFRIVSRLLTAAWLFGIIGPVIGYALIFVFAIISSPMSAGAAISAFVVSFLLFIPLFFVYTAFWPALMTGIVAGVLSLARARPIVYFPAVTATGALFCHEWYTRFPDSSPFNEQALVYAALGAGAAAICAFMLRRMIPADERA